MPGIAGFEKNSFVDYPGNVAAVIFYGGCNMNCWYCHNRHIISGNYPVTDFSEVLAFLKSRAGFLDAVVFSGGEATLDKDLEAHITAVRALGYKIKLDTNGTNPGVLERLMGARLIDYVAMDYKAPLASYRLASCVKDDIPALERSIDLLLNCGVAYEFRTTVIPQLRLADIETIAKSIRLAELYALQQYQYLKSASQVMPVKCEPHPPAFFAEAKEIALKYVKNCVVRGV